MRMTFRRPLGFAAYAAFAISLMLTAACQAGPEVVATRSLIAQPAGVRAGASGSKYFNVQGKGNGKYASFGVLTFPAPEGEEKSGKVEGLSLTLVQSLPSFAKDGKVRFFLLDESRVEPEGLKFDESSPNGLGGKFEGRLPLGSGEFKKVETGHADTFDLSLGEDARKLLERRLEGQGEIHILIVPDADDVAATYFGAGAEEAGQRPRLIFKFDAS